MTDYTTYINVSSSFKSTYSSIKGYSKYPSPAPNLRITTNTSFHGVKNIDLNASEETTGAQEKEDIINARVYDCHIIC